jgi:hypothetical protein
VSTTPTPSPSGWSRFEQISEEILNYAEVITAVAAAVPSPVTPFAAPALVIEKMLASLIVAHAAAKGQTVAQTLAMLPDLKPIP